LRDGASQTKTPQQENENLFLKQLQDFAKLCAIEFLFAGKKGKISVRERDYQHAVSKHRKDWRRFIQCRDINVPFVEGHHRSGDGRDGHYEAVKRHSGNVEQKGAEKQEIAFSACG
jgi:hypothetical protein